MRIRIRIRIRIIHNAYRIVTMLCSIHSDFANEPLLMYAALVEAKTAKTFSESGKGQKTQLSFL